jgi:Holliday junction resolvase-like predicted endonuclease
VRKSFALNTEPHVADIGGTEFHFHAEIMGDDFMDAYAELREQQQAHGLDLGNLSEVDPSAIRRAMRGIRLFIARQMLPESAELFTRLDVVANGDILGSFHDLDEAETAAAEHKGARVVDSFRLPSRVLVELLEWVVELFGGGSRPTTSSSASATASRKAGTRGSGTSPSKGSTHMPGR